MPAVKEFGIAFESPEGARFYCGGETRGRAWFCDLLGSGRPRVPGRVCHRYSYRRQDQQNQNWHRRTKPLDSPPGPNRDGVSGPRQYLRRTRNRSGLGASVKLWIEDQLGISYTRPVTALRETVAILNGLMGGAQLNHNGSVFKASGVRATFDLAARHVPIYLGVMASKALALAGEVADGVLLNSIVTPDFVGRAIDQIGLGADRAGRTLGAFSMGAYFTLSMSDNEPSAREAVKPYIAMILGPLAGQLKLPVFEQTGVTPELAGRFANGLITGRLAVDLVTDSTIDVMAIAGSPARCRERLAELVAAGITSPTIFLPPQLNFAQSAREIVTQLFPHFL